MIELLGVGIGGIGTGLLSRIVFDWIKNDKSNGKSYELEVDVKKLKDEMRTKVNVENLASQFGLVNQKLDGHTALLKSIRIDNKEDIKCIKVDTEKEIDKCLNM